ncbi:hypothetical protein KR026_008200 [Drosophila bipectinata]|nr:hypothetical protein KR026_008200 [Drosophila bipectinata]
MEKADFDTLQATSAEQDHDLTNTINQVEKQFLSNIYLQDSHKNLQQQATTMALEQYRLHLYNYALNIERFRCPHYGAGRNGSNTNVPWVTSSPYGQTSASIPAVNRMAALSTISFFPQTQRLFQSEEPKPQHSYIGLIAMAILGSAEMKLVLSDIYQFILDNYPYFRSRGPGWRNSIRHNLSLNDCFIKSGRSANGKGHYWAIHPANMEDFRKGDFRRRKAQRKVRKHMGLSVDDGGIDSPSPPPLDLTSPPPSSSQCSMQVSTLGYPQNQQYMGQIFNRGTISGIPCYTDPAQIIQKHSVMQPPHLQQQQSSHIAYINSTTTTTIANMYSHTRKRQFDVASLLAPDVQIDDNASENQVAMENPSTTSRTTTQTHHTFITKKTIHREVVLGLEPGDTSDEEVDTEIDVEVNVDVVDEVINPHPDVMPYPDVDDKEKTREVTNNILSGDDNISYLSDGRRSSSDADADHDIEDLEPHNYSISSCAGRSFGSSSSQHDESNSLEECPTRSCRISPTSLISSLPNSRHTSSLALTVPNGYIALKKVNPQILRRYYGTYMAATSRRASLETTTNLQISSMTPPSNSEIVTKK